MRLQNSYLKWMLPLLWLYHPLLKLWYPLLILNCIGFEAPKYILVVDAAPVEVAPSEVELEASSGNAKFNEFNEF